MAWKLLLELSLELLLQVHHPQSPQSLHASFGSRHLSLPHYSSLSH